ncbi:MAG: hypothetical protein G01um101438_58 [Parcubacteria group bacterium Gr01-1014_38]|nr:MAG: hypothetical protein G01um101438_58 [Parcubacteria group bacterium Gr01-1014_38]
MTRRALKRLFPWTVIAIVALGFALRFPFLTSRSLWFDEAFSWRLIGYFPSSEFFTRAAADVHPVLYYLLLWFWMLPARGTGPETTLLWLRALSVLFGAATVAAMILAGRVLFRSRWVACAAGLLTAVSAFQIQYAWEARMYTLGTVLVPLAMAALVRVAEVRSRGNVWWAGLGFGGALGALLHVHYYALFSWVALGAAKLAYFLGRMRRGASTVLRSPNFHAAEVGFWLSALLFLPQVPVFFAQAQRVQEAYWIPRIGAWSIPNTFARLFWGGAGDISPVWAVLASLAALFFVVFPLLRGRSFGDLVAATSFVIPLLLSAAVSLRTSVYLDRYFLFASLGLLLLLARTVSFLPSRLRMAILVALAGFGFLSVTHFWQQLDFPRHPGARAAAAFLAETAMPSEPIVVSSPFAYFPLSFHLGCDVRGGSCREGRSVRLYSETGEVAHFAGAPILTPNDIVGPEVLTSHVSRLIPRLWVVDTTGFGGSSLPVPPSYRLASETRFSELFAFQGDIIVRKYVFEPIN